MNERNMKTECWDCQHRRPVLGNAHIECIKPDSKMTGDSYGKRMGWFFYPFIFDPVWKTKLCDNFEVKLIKKEEEVRR